MKQPATNSLRWLYCLAILSVIFPTGMSGWVAMTVGGSPFQVIPYIGAIVFLALGIWRMYLVIRHAGTLESFVYSGLLKFLRVVGIIGMVIGVLYLVLRFSYRPIIQSLVKRPSESGVEFYVVGVYLSLLGGFGSLGIILFELSRLLGFE
jgi:hypothetical protein